MDWLEDTVRRSHATLVAARHASTREYLKEQCIGLAKRTSAILESVEPDDGTIGIDAIRRLYRLTGYKQTGTKATMVIVSEAHKMTLPAQNAFLKLLEEPPAGVKFILLCPEPQSLIITIRSRCQILNWLPKSQAEFRQEFPDMDKAGQTALYFASGGDTIEAQALLKGSTRGLQEMRELLAKPLGQAVLDGAYYATSRDKAFVTIDQMTKLAYAALKNADTDQKKRRWLTRLEAGLSAKEQLAAQANAKMVMDQLLLEFRG